MHDFYFFVSIYFDYFVQFCFLIALKKKYLLRSFFLKIHTLLTLFFVSNKNWQEICQKKIADENSSAIFLIEEASYFFFFAVVFFAATFFFAVVFFATAMSLLP